jgi:hypothetical protein
MCVYFDGYGELQTVEFKLIVPTEPQSVHLMLVNIHVNAPDWMKNLFLSQKTFGSATLLFTVAILQYVLPAPLSVNFKRTYLFISFFKG